jgi:glyoxylase I family protein
MGEPAQISNPNQLTRRTVITVTAATVATVGMAGPAAAKDLISSRREPMERVLGIGGFFFRAKDPAKLSKWYSDNLGINLPPQSYDAVPWQTDAGVTIFSPMELGSDFFGDWRSQWSINFRVRDLDAMARQLREAGSVVDVDPQTYPNGRFAKVNDPEGNAIQLWQPA